MKLSRRTSFPLFGITLGASLALATVVPTTAHAATPVRQVIPHDSATGIGDNPFDVAVDTGLHKAYVLNNGDKTISVIDTQNDAVVTVIGRGTPAGIGRSLTHVAIDSSAHEAYVVDVSGQTVTVIDTSTDKIVRVIQPDRTQGIGSIPMGVGIDSMTHRAYVANHGDSTVSVIDTVSHSVVKVMALAAGSNPNGIAVDQIAHRAYIANEGDGTVSIIDTTTDTVLTTIGHGGATGIGDKPRGIAVDPVRHKAYVTQFTIGTAEGTVAVVDTVTNRVTKVLPHAAAGGIGIGSHPSHIAFDPVSSTAYAANTTDGTVSVIDTVSDLVTEVIGHDSSTGIGASPYGLAIDPGTQRVYVGNSDDDTVSVIGIQSTAAVVRIGGADRFAVSAATSAGTFAPGVPTVYVASGENFPDALSASAAAGVKKSPVLLVTKDSIPAVVAAELRRLRPGNIVIMGGTNTISDALSAALSGFAPATRVGGADRYAVSAALSTREFGVGVPVAYVASGQNFPDALSGSAAAGHLNGPVLLVTKDGVPGTVATELERLKPRKIVVLGGPNSVSDATLTEVVAHTPPGTPAARLSGADRYAVSAAVSADTYPTVASTVYVASGAVFPDALSGSAAAIVNNAPVLLVTKDGISDAVAAELERLNPRRIVVLGGPNTVSDAVVFQLARYIFTL
ncbi:cell wall-binding repeat-containing protein [Herbiconiux sp. CPCC 205763]|uniref:Cell wall-binding repeat-containing protein n=1 Tax=Herbiconiux aconitum TaxID=2970913 RepID=A0ABT2GWN8_9MICO|nr:cell wall-binding repeat-containing protein [Herbiconiux aconitum]MCS5719344.1 cell wall-binding repeat-containing protein [Herbiconiux aconitum]